MTSASDCMCVCNITLYPYWRWRSMETQPRISHIINKCTHICIYAQKIKWPWPIFSTGMVGAPRRCGQVHILAYLGLFFGPPAEYLTHRLTPGLISSQTTITNVCWLRSKKRQNGRLKAVIDRRKWFVRPAQVRMFSRRHTSNYDFCSVNVEA